MQSSKKKILVTGAYGFIGRHVAKNAAQQGAYVYGIGHGKWAKSEWKNWGLSEWHSCDVTLDNLIKYANKPDIIIHCASGASVPFSVSNPYLDFIRSVNPVLDVLEYLRLESTNSRFVLTSSASVYGLSEKMPIKTNQPLNPLSPYGLHKKISEDLCCSYSRQFGIKTAIVRLFSVYGPGLHKQLLWDACNKFNTGEANFLGTGNETRDWIHVEDASKLLVLAAEFANQNSPCVNGGSGKAIEVKQILELLGSLFSDTIIPQFSRVERPGDPTHFHADITEALNWGWVPIKSLKKGIEEYVNWFKKMKINKNNFIHRV